MEYIVISVGKNDTAKTVSHKYKATEKSLFLLNGKPEFFEGERLIVLKTEGTPYTVQPFDTIETLSAKFGTTAEELMRINGVKNIFLGQTIILPEKNK